MTNDLHRPAPGPREGALCDSDHAFPLPSEPDLPALCADLAAALYDPAAGPDMLRRQAHLLDQILYALMNKHVTERIESGRFLGDWLDMVLRLQKQCTDTVKAVEATEYMKAIAPRRFPAIPPTPSPKTGKQTEGFE